MRISPVLLALAAALLIAPAGALGAGEPVLVSSPGALGALPSQDVANASDVEQVKGGGDGIGVSDDGRYTVFASQSDGLSPLDDNRYASVFRKDRVTGAVVLVSQSTPGVAADGYSFGPSVSDDGNLVAFTSAATNLAPGDTNPGHDVYVRNVSLGTTTLVSPAALDCDPAKGDEDCGIAQISGNGQFVAYASEAQTVSDANNALDVYRVPVSGSGALLVSQVEGGSATGNKGSWSPSIDDTGAHVAYETLATNLAVPAVTDTNNSTDVYVRTVATADNHLVSGPSGNQVATLDAGSRDAFISGDGLSVAFATSGKSADPTVADLDANQNVYARTLATNVNRLIDRATGLAGARSDAFTARPIGISDDGEWILFRADATTLGIGTFQGGRVVAMYVRRSNALLGTTNVLSVGPNGTSAGAYSGALSGNGARAVFTSVTPLDTALTRDELEIYGRSTNSGAETADLVSRPAGTGSYAATDTGASTGGFGGIRHRTSADGRYVVFTSTSDGLSTDDVDGDGLYNIYRRDLKTGAVDLVSRADGPAGAGSDAGGDDPAISADGSRVAFSSYATNMGWPGGWKLVYVRDLSIGSTTIVSRADGANGALDQSAGTPEISGDGRRVVYVVASGGINHVMLRDLTATTTEQVDRADGADGVSGNGSADAASISADGTRVAFLSSAKNLDPADTDNSRDAFVRDLGGAAPTTRLVSRGDGDAGAKVVGGVAGIGISGDGNRVAFKTGDQTVATEAGAWPPGDYELVVRDLAAGTTRLVSRAATPAAADVFDFTLDGTGDRIAFTTTATNLVGGAGGTETLFVRRVSTGDVTALAPWTAADPSNATAVRVPSISADGRCLLFEAQGTGPLAGPSPDYSSAYVQALDGGTCPAADAVVPPPDPPKVDPPPPPTSTPKITKLKLSHTKFTVAKKATATSARAVAATTAKATKKKAKKSPAGTTLSFTLSVKAAVTVTLEAKTTGRRSGKRCVRTTKKLAKKKQCTLYGKAGTLTRTAVTAGSAKIAFTGRVGTKALKPGAYRVTVVASVGGRSSIPARATFTVVRK